MNTNLIGYRHMLRLSQIEMAEIAGLTVSSYNRKELGKMQFKQSEMQKITKVIIEKYPETKMEEIFLKEQ